MYPHSLIFGNITQIRSAGDDTIHRTILTARPTEARQDLREMETDIDPQKQQRELRHYINPDADVLFHAEYQVLVWLGKVH